ncbi:MAG: N-acetyl-gamma-glutamyl-phosphate reductase [Cyclobacteriaceae bacterium]|nr:N-acetyl-gamma-glutamyl-phosphate reductase [Cyclobacteriaceae bacterium]
MIKVAITGGAGYTGGELLRILIHHPETEIVFVHSTSNAGNNVSDVHTDLAGETELKFTDQFTDTGIDVLFMCSGHGQSKKFLEENTVSEKVKIIDLSHDFRIEDKNAIRNFVYGLCEPEKEKIRQAQNIANPGCFATGIQLALWPLAANNLLHAPLHINATTGSTGAGQGLSPTSHFSWRSHNFSIYKPFTHQHLAEIKQSLKRWQSDFDQEIYLIPNRGGFTRGILTAIYTDVKESIEKMYDLYESFYAAHPFVLLTRKNPDVKQVVNTNKCVIYLEKYQDKLLIVSIIDNLVKGASGQAVQNMNLMTGLPETMGLGLKPVAF